VTGPFVDHLARGSLPDVYRFLLTPRWIALALLMTLAAATMVGLGLWQLSRYHERTDINAQIDAAAQAPPQQLAEVLAPPAGGRVGTAPTAEETWSVVTATGRYDAAHEIVARARSLDGTTGFEIVTPLVLADGTAVLVDRGFLPAISGVAVEIPPVPEPPAGQVVVVGRVHASESRGTAPEPVGDRLTVRRIDPSKISDVVPYPLYGGYLTLTGQTPPAGAELTPLPVESQNAAMNAGYTVQWWAFALLTLAGFGYLAYRHAHPSPEPSVPAPVSEGSAT
jgi:cytochrome oxidase assembly protein ShyY1